MTRELSDARRRRARPPWMLALATAAVAALPAPHAAAHHAFGAEFDRDAPIQLRGRVVKLEWINPHAWIHIDVAPAGEPADVWMAEGGTPNTLLRRGLRRDCIAPGTELVVDGYQSKDRSLKRVNGKDITLPDGRKFFMGSTGAGAPPGGVPGRRNAEYERDPCA